MKKNKGTDSPYLKYEEYIETRMGGWFPGDRVVYRGKDLHRDLHKLRWMGLLVYGVTGKIYKENQLKMFEALWSLGTSYPDPRLWNNRVAAFAGTTRSLGSLGVSAAVAVSDATIYGFRTNLKTVDFLKRTSKLLEDGNDLHDLIKQRLKTYRYVPGYGRPVVNRDERIAPIMRLAKEYGCADGKYLKLALEIETVVKKWRQSMNLGAIGAAIVADQGMSSREYYLLSTPSFLAGILPCYVDASEKPAGTILPLRTSRIDYVGPSIRNYR